jgi:hypothetical protein
MTVIACEYRGDAALTRRGLLAAGGAALATVALADAARIAAVAAQLAGARAGTGTGAALDTGVPAHLRRSTFTGLVGDRFELAAAGRRVTGRLIAVDELGRGADPSAGPREDAFAVVFHSDGRARLRDDTMTVSHAALGAFPLFISRSGAGRDGQDYVAIINRVSPYSGDRHVRTIPR